MVQMCVRPCKSWLCCIRGFVCITKTLEMLQKNKWVRLQKNCCWLILCDIVTNLYFSCQGTCWIPYHNTTFLAKTHIYVSILLIVCPSIYLILADQTDSLLHSYTAKKKSIQFQRLNSCQLWNMKCDICKQQVTVTI